MGVGSNFTNKGSIASGRTQSPLSLFVQPALPKAIGPQWPRDPASRLQAARRSTAPRLAPLGRLQRPGQLERKNVERL